MKTQFLLRKTKLFNLIFFLASFAALAHEGVIKGVVTDSSSQQFIPFANVLLEDAKHNKQNSATDELGNFKFTDLEEGKYQLSFYSLGYAPLTIPFELKDDEVKTISVVIKLRPRALNLSEITVTPVTGLGQTIDLVGQIDKNLRPTNSAQDLLRLVPGLFIAQHAGGGKAEQIFVRGFDCDHGTDFAVFFDGMPVNMVSHAHGQGYADFHFVIPETVEALKVSKGTYSAKYGDFATAGAGDFTSKNYINKNMIKLEYGRFDTYRGMAMINLIGKEKHLFSKRKESAYIASEYFFSNSYFDAPQKFKRFNIFGKYNGLLTERTSLMMSLSHFNSNWNASGQIPERAVQQSLISRFGSIDPSEGGRTDRTNANAILTTVLKNDAVFKNQIYYSNYNFNLFSNFTFFLNNPINGDEINQSDKNRNIYGYNGTYESKYYLGDKSVKSTIGIGTRIDDAFTLLKHATQRVITDTVTAGRILEQNLNIYFDQTINLTNKFSLNAGLRADYFTFKYSDIRSESYSGATAKGRISPKLSMYYTLNPSLQFFARSGYGFHSNDARVVVRDPSQNTLPKAIGYEIGSTFKITKKILVNAVLWGLDKEQELVYVGDEGIVDITGATRRLGGDLSLRYEITKFLYADLDLNYSHGRYLHLPEGQNYIPLAPSLTSVAGITLKQENGFNASVRYRYINSRPANEDNSVVAKGYFILDAIVKYTKPRYEIGLSAENLLNTIWNQAQFDTQTRLKREGVNGVDELHFTAGTPFFIKAIFTVFF